MHSRLVYSDPEARQFLSARAITRELQWLADELGEAAFLRSLVIYGQHSPESAKHEFWKLQQEL
jgi:hypothetical protein